MAKFTAIDTGVLFSKGRGKARVELQISFAELERWAKRNAVDAPKLMHRSFGRACSGLKKQLAVVMQQGGGVNGVPRFKSYEDFTAEYKRSLNKESDGKIGGVLADDRRIVAFRRGGWQYIGWPDRMENLVEAFQEGRGGSYAEEWLNNRRVRHYLHFTAQIRDVPRSYVHNERAVLEPHFHDHVAANLEVWAKNIFYKDLARQMMKARGA